MGKPDRETEEGDWGITIPANWIGFLLLALFILTCYFVYPSSKALEKGPFSEHMWRQSDGHAMTYNLYLDSSNFLSPRTLDLGIGKEARGGMEFQFVYYLAAQWDQIKGSYSSSTINWFHYILLILGFLVFSLRCFLLKEQGKVTFYLITFLLLCGIWSSGLLQYYGMNNFPDIAALAFTLIAFSIFPGISDNHLSNLTLSSVFFLLAGLIKVTFLIYPIALYGAVILLPKGNQRRWHYSIILILILSLAFSWILYMRAYNSYWNSTGFLTSFRPIWELQSGEIEWIWERLKFDFLPSLMKTAWFYVLAILFMINLYYLPKRLKLIQSATLTGLIAYILLFYAQFSVHSYYLIICYPFFLMIIFYFLKYTWKIWPQNKLTLLIFSILLIIFNYQQIKATEKYLSENYKIDNQHHTYLEITPDFLDENLVDSFLNKNNVPANARFISIPDGTTNVSLHTLKRYGWSLPADQFTVQNINQLKREGASYLMHWGGKGILLDSTYSALYQDSLPTGTKLYQLKD